MTLVYEQHDRSPEQPGLHVFMVGVSMYPYLSRETEAHRFGMRQLHSSVASVYNIYTWLLENQNNLSVPLATCRLLLSPSKQERFGPPEFPPPEPCSLNNFLQEARAWRNNASSHPDNMTLFYFAGYGVHQGRDNALLFMDDFLDGIGGMLTKTVSSNSIFAGMAPYGSQSGIARTQLTFLDTIGVPRARGSVFETLPGTSVFDVTLSGADNRCAPIYHATMERDTPVPGEATLFGRALRHCLEGGAGELLQVEEGMKWAVSTYSLAEALKVYLSNGSQSSGPTPDLRIGGLFQPATICLLDGPPTVEVQVEIEPLEALPYCSVQIFNERGDPVSSLPRPLVPHPYLCQLPAGFYSFKGVIDPPLPQYSDDFGTVRFVKPPNHKLKVRVAK